MTWYTPNMVITPSSAVNEQEGKHDECVTSRLRIFGATFATPGQLPSVKLTGNLVEEAMTDDSAEIEPALLGNNGLKNACFSLTCRAENLDFRQEPNVYINAFTFFSFTSRSYPQKVCSWLSEGI